MSNNKKSFAIIIVCYNRIDGVKRLLQSLESADYCGRNDISLVFSIDFSGDDSIYNFVLNYNWKYGEKRIRAFKEKQGLKKHILQCGNYANEYDIIAVFEDDIYVSNSFFSYAYESALFYCNDENIAGISLYSYQKNWLDWKQRFEPAKGNSDVYFMRIAQSWGQVWTSKQWNTFIKWYEKNQDYDFDKKLLPNNIVSWPKTSSWLKYFCLYLIKTGKYFVYPYYGLSTNFSDVGQHNNKPIIDFQVELVTDKHNWIFERLNKKTSIQYDEYMNRLNLEQYIGLNDGELTNNLNGVSNKSIQSKYLLSMDILNYKIVRTYGLCLHPIELSIINNIQGNDIYLYDTSIIEDNKASFSTSYKRIEYLTRWSGIRDYFYHPTTKELILELKKKIKKKLFKKRK